MSVLNRLFFIAFLFLISCAKDNGDSPESEKPVVFAVETNGLRRGGGDHGAYVPALFSAPRAPSAVLL